MRGKLGGDGWKGDRGEDKGVGGGADRGWGHWPLGEKVCGLNLAPVGPN